MDKTRTLARKRYVEDEEDTVEDFAKTIWEEGWAQAFITTGRYEIPKELRECHDRYEILCEEIQPAIDKFLERYPWSYFEEKANSFCRELFG